MHLEKISFATVLDDVCFFISKTKTNAQLEWQPSSGRTSNEAADLQQYCTTASYTSKYTI